MAKFDLYGMCNPLFDIQAEISHEILSQLGYAPGGMFLINLDEQRNLIPKIVEHVVNTDSGGSGANTMITFGLLGGNGVYTGHVGSDEHGSMYRAALEKCSIKPNLGVSDGETGLCVVLITPDAERTMCTYLGKALDLKAEDVFVPDLTESKYLYITGYLWDTPGQKEAVLRAMKIANDAGVKVAFSLSDPFCVNRHPQEFRDLIRSHIDILFGNDQEVLALTGKPDVQSAVDELLPECGLVVVTEGVQGSTLASTNESVKVPCYKVEAVDSTGAGDAFAAGVLYGLVNDLSLNSSGHIAGYVAGKVVGKLGPRLKKVDHNILRLLKNGASYEDIEGMPDETC